MTYFEATLTKCSGPPKHRDEFPFVSRRFLQTLSISQKNQTAYKGRQRYTRRFSTLHELTVIAYLLNNFQSSCFIMKSILPWLLALPILTLSAPAPQDPAAPDLTVDADGYIKLGPENHAWPLKDPQNTIVGGFSPFAYIPDKTFSSTDNRKNILSVGDNAIKHRGQMTNGGQFKWPSIIPKDAPQLVVNGPMAQGHTQPVSYDLIWMIAKALLDYGDLKVAFDKGVQFTVIDLQGNPITSVSTNGPGLPNVVPGPIPDTGSLTS